MDVLCFDIGSGGIRGVRFDRQLRVCGRHDVSWNFNRDAAGHATLSAYDLECAFTEVANALTTGSAPGAVSIGCFMHSFLVLSSCCAALTPIFTWMDNTGPQGVEAVRRKLGPRFHEHTGCHYHPMFPVFKLAARPPGRGNRVASPKAWLAWELTGSFVDDLGMASASGLLHVQSGKWDTEVLEAAGLEVHDLPRLVDPDAVVGTVTEAGARFGIPPGTTLVSGSGDGFLANIGSACTAPARMAVTLGTSGVARQMVPTPALNAAAGTFCYRASSDAFLLGCASSNGGNVLDWARRTFGPMAADGSGGREPPIFLPWRNGERSLEWDPDLQESWHGRDGRHTPAELSRAVVEGVLFNIAQYVEIIERESRVVAQDVVLSGNGFLDASLAVLLATLLGRELLHPASAGLATLRGAAVCAWQALGHDVRPVLEKELRTAARVQPVQDAPLLDRFHRFKELRAAAREYCRSYEGS